MAAWLVDLARRPGSSTWIVDLDRRPGSSTWIVDLGRRSGSSTWIVDPSIYYTPVHYSMHRLNTHIYIIACTCARYNNVEKSYVFQRFQNRRLKNTLLSIDSNLKRWKTKCCSMLSNSNIEKPNAFEWFKFQMLKNVMRFNDCQFKGWTTRCFVSIVSNSKDEQQL